MNVPLLRELAKVMQRKRDLEAEVRGLNQQISALETAVTDELLSAGVDSVPLNMDDGSRMTLYLQHSTYARPTPNEEEKLHTALEELGFGEVVKRKVNHQTLNAVVKELTAEGRALPEALAATLVLSPVTRVRARTTR